MRSFDWNDLKNELLKIERGVCFEDVQTAVEEGRLLDDTVHHNQERYPGQRLYVVAIGSYIYLVPYVIQDNQTVFLKTIIPSRKAVKKYKKGDNK